VQLDAPTTEKDPAGHGKQETDPVVSANFPLMQTVHCPAIVPELLPTGHWVHVDAPAVEKDPAAHCKQSLEPGVP
jgi:hypothetical protein